MARFGMIIDVDRCTGCYNCFLSCRDEHAGNDYLPLSAAQPDMGQQWMQVREHERGSFPKVKVSYVPVPCLQCGDAPCMQAATGGAVYRRPDGIVVIDPEKAKGQRAIVDACPFGAVFWNETTSLPQKCTFCAHLIDGGWGQPRCAEACPTQAIVFGDLDDPGSEISRRGSSQRLEELQSDPTVLPLVKYLNLPARFIAGEVVLTDNQEEAAVGVRVLLNRGSETWSAVTNSYGDFEFEGLGKDADYLLQIAHPGYRRLEMKVQTNTDVNLGPIMLHRKD